MAVDLSQITEVLQAALLRDLGEEVDLIFRYGSHLMGNAHAYSDLDISYVPVQEATRHHITVLVADTLCDLYPIHWSQLESMANFENVSSTVLLNYQIVYQRSAAAAERMQRLAARLAVLQQPAARPTMLTKAQELFQRTGYPYYLLRQQAARGHLLACLQQAQQILRTVLHCLAVCNQACIDTRKLEQVLALPKLPANFAETVDQLTPGQTTAGLVTACERLLESTRDLLLAEQRQLVDHTANFATAFGAGYPELKADLQHILLACERQDRFALQGPLLSLYHELSLAIALAVSGIRYSSFNSLAEYEQDLVALGFPALLPLLEAGDFAELHRQCLIFDQHLRQFLVEHGVNLYTYATIEDLQTALEASWAPGLKGAA
jgi:hypothetical protein